MTDRPVFTAFLIASVMVAITPGPGVLYIVARALHGRRSGLASVAGVALGNLTNAIAASVGLVALFAFSPWIFLVVKYAGVAYLVYLGLQALRQPAAVAVPVQLDERSSRGILRDGFLVALLNPKTTLFFSAFLPQFIDPRFPVIGQSLVLGTTFVVIAASTDTAYALAAGAAAPTLARTLVRMNFGRYLSAGALLGLAAFTAIYSSRHQK